jgi:DNA-binding transcriptional regulator YiaG
MAPRNSRKLSIRRRAKKLKEEGLSPLIAEACAGIDEPLEAAETGETLDDLCTIHTRKLDLKPRPFGPEEVRAVRMKLNASQALLASFIGVNTQTFNSWEHGKRKVPLMARHYLDDLVDLPTLWPTRTGIAVKAE